MTYDGYHSVTCVRDCEWCPDCPCHDDGGMWDDDEKED